MLTGSQRETLGRCNMRITRFLSFGAVVALASAGYLTATRTRLDAQQPASVKLKPDEIGGVVSTSKGPEAGVWVIAETTDLPTRYIKEVVTDDRGRYLIPDLPKAKYTVWARGYGLVDSPKIEAETGESVNLKPTVAPDAKTAAQLYPANYWYALLKVPEKNEFPGTGPSGNGISPNIKNSGPVDPPDQDRQLRILPPARQRIHAHHSSDVQQVRFPCPGLGAARAVRTSRQGHDGRLVAVGPRTGHRTVRRLDHPHRSMANCRRRRRRGRRESSATS